MKFKYYYKHYIFVFLFILFSSFNLCAEDAVAIFNYQNQDDSNINFSIIGQKGKQTKQRYCSDNKGNTADVITLDKSSKDISLNCFEIKSSSANISKLSIDASNSSSGDKSYIVLYWTGDAPSSVDNINNITYLSVTLKGYNNKDCGDDDFEDIIFPAKVKTIRIYNKLEVKDDNKKKFKEGDGAKINFKTIKVVYDNNSTPLPPPNIPTLETPDPSTISDIKEELSTDSRPSKSFNIKGSYLNDNVNIKAPEGLEISEDNGVTWTSALSLAAEADGSINKVILVHSKYGKALAKGQKHIISDNILISTTDVNPIILKVTGEVSNSSSSLDTEAPVISSIPNQTINVSATDCGKYYPVADYTNDVSLIALVKNSSTDNVTLSSNLVITLSGQSIAANSMYTSPTSSIQIVATVTDEAGNSSSKNIMLIFKWINTTQPIISTIPDFCKNSSPYTLTLSSGTETSTGVYGGSGISGKVFTPSSVTAGSYIITYSDISTGCSVNSNSFKVNDIPTISLTPLSANVCANTQLKIDATTNSYTPSKDKYVWTVGGIVDNTQITSSYIINTSTPGNYSISATITDGFGCTSLPANATAIVEEQPSAPDVSSKTLCQSKGLLDWNSLVANYNGTLVWYNNQSATNSITPNDIDLSLVSIDSLYVSVKSSVGCESQRKKVVVNVLQSPQITKLYVVPKEHDVYVYVSGGTMPYSYSCESFGGLSSSGYIDLGIMQSGKYILEVTDNNKCFVDTTFSVVETPIVPSKVFTPNGDGINDTWKIDGISCYPETKIYIFDRYARQLAEFKGSDYAGWDGKFKGHDVPEGDYWYVIEIRETGDRETGHFLLKR